MSLKPVLRHLILGASKNVKFSTVSEFDEIRHGSQILRDDSSGEVCFVIRDLEKFQVLTEITVFSIFPKIGIFSGLTFSPP